MVYLVIISVPLFAIFIYLHFIMNSSIKSESVESTPPVGKEKRPDIFGMFTKPQKVTEEEVSISKEKKICLVCKGNLSRVLYMCPECNTFYCKKCSEALSDLESMCWVCDAPFDVSKPVKKMEKEEEEIKFEKK